MELTEEQKKAAAEKAEADKKAAETPRATPKRKRPAHTVKVGDKVGFVHGWKRNGIGTATVIDVGDNGNVDIKLDGLTHGPGGPPASSGKPQTITDAPHDPTATKPDSWHFIEE